MTSDALPLDDITVLDLSRDIPGAWCTRLLGALGARVLLVEPPGGSPLRARAPFKGDESGPDTGGLFLYLAAGKRSVTLDPATPDGRALLLDLLDRADVLVEDAPPGTLAGCGLDIEAVRTRRPEIVACAITPFGQDGPYRDWVHTEIVAQALGGLMETVGLPEREPLKIGGSPAMFNAGGTAFTSIVAALLQRDATGEGQTIDISIQETAAFSQIHSSIVAAFQGEPIPRRPNSMIAARDGWVSLGLEMGVAADIWPQICELVGRPDLADDPRFATAPHRRENREALNAIMEDWVRGQSKEEIYHRLQGMRTIAGYVANVADLHANAQLRARGFFQEIDHPAAGPARYPGLPFRVGDAPVATGRAPLLGEHQGEVLADLAGSRDAQPLRISDARERAQKPPQTSLRNAARLPAPDSRLPLTGVRILDLSQVAIGPYATFLLASLGAEVIKVESHRRGDTSRGAVRPVTATQLNQYPGREPGERPWNRTAIFNQRNRGKRGVTLDFTTPAGKRLLKRLVAVSDAVVENFRASVLDRQGLGWDALREVNPRLVYLKLSSQGVSGPERDYGSLGSTLEQTGGIASITGYTDGIPLLTNETYPDPVAAVLGAGALIAGLRRARRTGRGQFVDLSQREVTAAILGEAMMDYALNGRVAAPIGNRDPRMAPHGVYPCRDEGGGMRDDAMADAAHPSSLRPHPSGRWIAIAVADDAQWRGLLRAMGDPAWGDDPRFATVAGRLRHQEEIDAHLAAWTADQNHIELTELLQRHGVPAGAVLDGVELLADRQLVARGWWDRVAPTEIGRPFPMISPPWRMSCSPYRPLAPAPCLGEHNDPIFRDLLGLDEEQYAALGAESVIGVEAEW